MRVMRNDRQVSSATALRRCTSGFGASDRAPGAVQTIQNDLGRPGGRRASSRRFGGAMSPSRWACFRAALRARRMASAFSRALRSDGFS